MRNYKKPEIETMKLDVMDVIQASGEWNIVPGEGNFGGDEGDNVTWASEGYLGGNN